MDKVELKRKLDDVGIRPEDYSLDGILKPMATVLKLLNSKWCTFDYDERGRVQDERIFDTAQDLTLGESHPKNKVPKLKNKTTLG